MAEFVGSEDRIDLQRRIQKRHPWIAETPGLVNGGRIVHFLEPSTVGWDVVRQIAAEDQLVGFSAVDRISAIDDIHMHLGPVWKTPVWDVFVGEPREVSDVCKAAMAGVPIPDSWSFTATEQPTDSEITRIQELNVETGVSPYPAYYSRGGAVPIVTVCLVDERGDLVATASATDRHHLASRLAQTCFAGMVSVSPGHRGKGLGKLVNARMLMESLDRFAWRQVHEQAAPDNVPSRAMIEGCGLRPSDLVSIGAVNSDETFSR